jgi:hypothetical protein
VVRPRNVPTNNIYSCRQLSLEGDRTRVGGTPKSCDPFLLRDSASASVRRSA